MKLTKSQKKAYEKDVEKGGILRITAILGVHRGNFSQMLNGKKNVTPTFAQQMQDAKKQYLEELAKKKREDEELVKNIIPA